MGEPSDSTLRVLVADDSLLLREGITKLLTRRGFDVVDEAVDAVDLLRKVELHHPDVAIVDIRMPPTGTDEGLRAAAELAHSHPNLAVLILSDYIEADYAVRLLESGSPGRGYLLKETVTDPDSFAAAIHRVAAGESVVDSVIVRRVIGQLRDHQDPLAALSEREGQILALMAQGRSNAAIAEHFTVSPRTVEGHVRSVFLKLGLDDTPDDHRRVRAVLTYLHR